MTKLVIIDYNAGNLQSVFNGLKKMGHHAEITKSPDKIIAADGIILPGVGTFQALLDNMKELGQIDALLHSIKNGTPYLGICIGMQILFEYGYENGKHEGLGLFKGDVTKFKDLPQNMKVPHMGWNNIKIKQKENNLLSHIKTNDKMYFVHSYHVVTPQKEIVSCTTNYGYDFVSGIHKDNIYATQFHPEKSGALGLEVLNKFAKKCKREN